MGLSSKALRILVIRLRLVKSIILCTTEISEGAKTRLISALGDGMEFKQEESGSNSSSFGQVEVLIVGPNKWITNERIEAMKNLRCIQSVTAGVDHINFDVISSKIIVCSNAGAFGDPIAEFVVGAIISLKNGFVPNVKENASNASESETNFSLNGKTVGILGTGGIGQSVARVAKSFGMTTIGVNTTGHATSNFDSVMKMESLNEPLERVGCRSYCSTAYGED